MHKIPARSFMTSDQIEERANAIELEAAVLEPGVAKDAQVEKARMLRSYADMKRLLTVTKRAS